MYMLRFEKQLYELREKIEELKQSEENSGNKMTDEVKHFEKLADAYADELYSNLTPLQKIQIARHPERPNFKDFVERITDNFIEFHGDRVGTDDRAIVGGPAEIDGIPVMVVGTYKGKSTKENLVHNFGMPQPQGYRKALRLFKHAEKFNMPIITLIDTPGAYPGIKAEETAQGNAIAVNLAELAKLTVPVIAIITGEGCSGGALGLAVANKVMMLEYAYYTVISPEGCASILWRDVSSADKAANALKITPQDLLKYEIIDDIIKEPQGGAHYDYDLTCKNMKKKILKNLKELMSMSDKELREDRYQKFRTKGVFAK
jgi:acetyl-CoA carboxylase carboxyl transferase subunit alpha